MNGSEYKTAAGNGTRVVRGVVYGLKENKYIGDKMIDGLVAGLNDLGGLSNLNGFMSL